MRLVTLSIFILLGSSANSEGLFSWLFSSGKEISAEIKLVNNCLHDSKYFVVRDLDSGKSSVFTNGFARLATKLNLRYSYSSRNLLKMSRLQVMQFQPKRK